MKQRAALRVRHEVLLTQLLITNHAIILRAADLTLLGQDLLERSHLHNLLVLVHLLLIIRQVD